VLKAPTIASNSPRLKRGPAKLKYHSPHQAARFPKLQLPRHEFSRVKLYFCDVIAPIACHGAAQGLLGLGARLRSCTGFLGLALPRQCVNYAHNFWGCQLARLCHSVSTSFVNAQSLCFVLSTNAGLLELRGAILQRRSNLEIRHRHAEHI
jgi:hypothetical protein